MIKFFGYVFLFWVLAYTGILQFALTVVGSTLFWLASIL
jgi:hypothetical protein